MRHIAIALAAVSLTAAEKAGDPTQPAGYVLGQVTSDTRVLAGKTDAAATGIGTWPVAVGDVLQTGASQANVVLKERSTVTLEKRTDVLVASLGDNRGLFHLKLGGLLIQAAEKSIVGVCVASLRIEAIGPARGIVQLTPENKVLVKADGNFLIDPRKSCTPKVGLVSKAARPGVKSLVSGGAAGGGGVITIADQIRGSDPVSPSQPPR